MFETILGTTIAVGNGWPLWTGIVGAVAVALVFDALFLFAFWKVLQTRRAIDRLRRVLLRPALIVLAIALPVFLMSRVVRGYWAVLLNRSSPRACGS